MASESKQQHGFHWELTRITLAQTLASVIELRVNDYSPLPLD
jgi:hypothetical protein